MNQYFYGHPYQQHWAQNYTYYPYRQMPMNTDEFTPDQWVQYIQPLVQRALQEAEEGINLTHLFQEFILSGVLVGRGSSPEAAIEQVEQWEKGESKLLQQSKAMRWW
ncbi:hypothetical protein FZW96_17930 [Bacillus sp. BGMRC 2118]|nr:hypothetical protein FZW96_17930 [Bacillus sp. BGMRC 2118]